MSQWNCTGCMSIRPARLLPFIGVSAGEKLDQEAPRERRTLAE